MCVSECGMQRVWWEGDKWRSLPGTVGEPDGFTGTSVLYVVIRGEVVVVIAVYSVLMMMVLVVVVWCRKTDGPA